VARRLTPRTRAIIAVDYAGQPADLDELAELCADERDYEMFFVAPPLPFTGTAGAPPGPVVIR